MLYFISYIRYVLLIVIFGQFEYKFIELYSLVELLAYKLDCSDAVVRRGPCTKLSFALQLIVGLEMLEQFLGIHIVSGRDIFLGHNGN